MILPFVREIFAELEQSSSFDRVRRHLSLGVGRRRVSGLTNTARSLYIPLLARAAKQPVIVVVADNKAAEALEPTLKAGCELTGAVDPDRVVRVPMPSAAIDVDTPEDLLALETVERPR